MDYVRVGIIGVGNIGTAHLHWICDNPDCKMRVTALCDTDKKRQSELKSEFPDMPVFDRYDKLILSGFVDAVIISTPHYFHPEIAVFAFQNGLHVLTEKPSGVSVGEVRKMNEAAKKSDRVFGVMFNQRTDPLYAKTREIVQSGVLGTPKRLSWIVTNWYRTQSYYNSSPWRASWSGEGGGILLNQAPHNLDLWQWIFGMPSRIFAHCGFGKYHNISVEDDVTILAEYENGATATFITSTGECPGTNRLEIVGDRGKLVLENGKLKLLKLKQSEREFCFSSQESFYQPETEYEEIVLPEVSGHQIILKNFADAI